jgi:hypothetical protein
MCVFFLFCFFVFFNRVLLFAAVPVVEPPPFEPMPGSYSPGLTGTALYFTDTGEQGRYPPRYEANERDGKVSVLFLKSSTS